MEKQLRDKLVQKEYVCRVEGEFPRYYHLFLYYITDSLVLFMCDSSYSEPIIVDKPIDILSHKIGLYRISDSGKESVTRFERMWTDGKESVVRCVRWSWNCTTFNYNKCSILGFPETGRTHQIRIHCQYLGININDCTKNKQY